jgi:hypothetical protein
MKTPEELAKEWSVVVFDESELPEHEKTKLSDLATYRAMGTLGFLAGYQAGFDEAKNYWANQPKYDADPIEKLIED